MSESSTLEKRGPHKRSPNPMKGVPLIDPEFSQLLEKEGVSPNDIGFFAAEMEAAPEDKYGGIHAWQTFCHKLNYNESGSEISKSQKEASLYSQGEAEKEINTQLGFLEIPRIRLLPYDWRVDLLMEKIKLEKEGSSQTEIKEKLMERLNTMFRKILRVSRRERETLKKEKTAS